MLGIDYGSDSDSDSPAPPSQPPANNALSQPKPKRTPAPKKITLELPRLPKHDDEDDLEQDRPVTKKPRLGGGRPGSSALLSMLPAPTKKIPESPAPERVLGGGRPGVFYSAEAPAAPSISEEDAADQVASDVQDTLSTSMMPPSLALAKSKTKAPQKPATTPSPAVDFFSLQSTPASRISSAPSVPTIPSTSLSVSAAPKVEEYQPPSPTIHDPYPGYYTLPSGQWAMYDPAYYRTYSDRWAKEYEDKIREYEKGVSGKEKGFEGADGDGIVDVNAEEQLDAARKEREEKKALTREAARETELKAPNMKINPQKLGGLARSRHQLSTLLTEAYTNREALEERIAQGRRNRKEAGNKYGF